MTTDDTATLAPCALCGAPAAPPGCRRCARVVAAGEGVWPLDDCHEGASR